MNGCHFILSIVGSPVLTDFTVGAVSRKSCRPLGRRMLCVLMKLVSEGSVFRSPDHSTTIKQLTTRINVNSFQNSPMIHVG